MNDELKKKLTERFEFLAKRSEVQVSADIYDVLLKAYLAGGEYGYELAEINRLETEQERLYQEMLVKGINSIIGNHGQTN